MSQIRVAGRATQGVRIINLRENDAIASVMAVPHVEEEETPAAAENASSEAEAGVEPMPSSEGDATADTEGQE